MGDRLTAKQQVFVEEYLRSWNATEAARNAGYSSNHLHTNASKLLRNTTIAAEIERRLSELQMSADEVLLRTADIARGDLSEWITDSGNVDVAALKASGKGHLLKKWKLTRRVTKTKNGDEFETTTTEFELYPADAAHDRLMRYHGLYNDRVRVVGWQDEVIELLRRGELQPGDVEAAYPDLAPEFFVKAGVKVGSDRTD
jgi:phage terminase small subunit